MKTHCPHCSVEFDATEGSVCPRCGKVVVVDAIKDGPGVIDFVDDDESSSRTQKAPADSPHVARPECTEKTLNTAKECGFGGEGLTPDELSGVWRDGNKLVMSKDADLPYRCVKTNEPAETLLRRNLSWHAPVIFVTIPAGLLIHPAGILIYVVLAIVLSTKVDIRVPISGRIQRRRWLAIATGWLIGLGILVALALACVFVAGAEDPHWKGTAALVTIGLVFIVIIAIDSTRSVAIVTPAKITDSHVWLRGVHSAYLDQLPEWPGER